MPGTLRGPLLGCQHRICRLTTSVSRASVVGMEDIVEPKLQKVTRYLAAERRVIYSCRTCGELDTVAPYVHTFNTGHAVTTSR